jgi:hypothetical protein
MLFQIQIGKKDIPLTHHILYSLITSLSKDLVKSGFDFLIRRGWASILVDILHEFEVEDPDVKRLLHAVCYALEDNEVTLDESLGIIDRLQQVFGIEYVNQLFVSDDFVREQRMDNEVEYAVDEYIDNRGWTEQVDIVEQAKVTELPPDGSYAQYVLGGFREIKYEGLHFGQEEKEN